MKNTTEALKIIKLSEPALNEIKRLVEDDIEIILIFEKSGEISILEADSERKYMVSENSTKLNLVYNSPETSCNRENQFATGKFEACVADDKIVKDFTVNRIVREVVPLGMTFYTESGCFCNARRCVHW